MKNRSLLILLYTILLGWLLPSLYQMLNASSSGRLFVYYSSITKNFCVIEKDKITDELVRKDISTNERYTTNEFDSILPFLYYRQLLADGRMPAEVGGKKITAKEANLKSFFFKYKPKAKNSPQIGLYPLFESASGRVDLKMPDDFFRLKEDIEFLIPDNNTVNIEKSKIFKAAFDKENFTFPAKQVAGNPSPNKPYDEGYFIIDKKDKLFHLKMKKEVPFLKEVSLPKDCIPTFFAPYEPDDRSFYGFLFDQKGAVYVLNTQDYVFQKLETDPISLDDNFIVVMGNPLYWTVRIISKVGEEVFAFEANTKKKIAQHSFSEKKVNKKWNNYIFPFELKWTNPLSKYVLPQWKWGHYAVLGVNILLAFMFLFLRMYRETLLRKIIVTLWIVLTGIFGLLAVVLVKEKNENKF